MAATGSGSAPRGNRASPAGAGNSRDAHDVETQPSLPTRIGPYRILRVLGTGGMGTVYLAVHEELHREVALKVLSLSAARNRTVMQRFRDEARAAAMPNHENIVVFYEHGEDQGHHYLALEYVKGHDLLYWIDQKGTLPVNFSIHVVRQVARALEHAFSHGFVHRDIKPSNLMVTKDKVVKLTDMGLARQLEDLENEKVTRDGTTVGTVDYMAPEQARSSRDADIRSDIYALGCTWYHMLAGQVPYPGGSALERLYKHVSEKTPDVRKLNPKVPADVAALIASMMAKEAKDRPQTAAELLEEINGLASRRGGVADSDSELERPIVPAKARDTKKSAPLPARKPSVDKLTVIWVVASVLALALVVVAMGYFSRRESPVGEQTPIALGKPLPDPPAPETKEPVKTPAKVEEKPKPAEATPPKPDPAPSEEPSAKPKALKSFDFGANLTPEQKKELLKLVEGDPSKKPVEKDAPAFRWKISLGASGNRPAPTDKKIKLPEEPRAPQYLARPATPLTGAQRESILGPWLKPPAPLARPGQSFSVGRITDTDTNTKIAATVKQAWNAALVAQGDAGGGPVWIEFQSSGPLFDGNHTFVDRPVVLRAADGHIPVLVYQSLKNATEASWFTFAENQRAEIEGIHFILFVGDLTNDTDDFSLFLSQGCDITFRRCSFTVIGEHRKKLTVARVLSGRRFRDPPPTKVHFKDCVIRGNGLSAVTLDGAADVLMENCCALAKSSEIFFVREPDRPAPMIRRDIRVVDSSLQTGGDLLRARFSRTRPSTLAVSTAGSVWASSLTNVRRPMVHIDLIENAELTRESLEWREAKVVYAGWPAMLEAQPAGKPARSIAIDQTQWDELWDFDGEEEQFVEDKTEVAIDPKFVFAPYPVFGQGPWEFEPSGASIRLGYDPTKCLPLTRFWFESAFGALEPLTIDTDSPLRDPADRTSTLVSLDIDPKEKSLAEEIKKNASASRIEVRLSGTGKHPIDPIHVTGQTLVLRFPPAPAPGSKAEPLVLTPRGAGEASFHVKNGSLQIENGRFEYANLQRSPERFAHVIDGELAFLSTRIEATLQAKLNNLTELVRFEADNSKKSDEWRRLILQGALLVSAAPLISFEAPMTALVADNSVFMTGADALRVNFGELPPKDWVGAIEISKCTFSAAGSAIRLSPYPTSAGPPAYPLVCDVEDTLFTDLLDTRGGPEARARTGAVLSFEANILSKGIVAWQGRHNAFDRRLSRLLAPVGDAPKISFENSRLDWTRIWGRRHETNSFEGQISFEGRLRSDRFSIDGLVLSPTDPANVAASDGKQVGADLALFGLRLRPTTRAQNVRATDDPASVPLKKESFLDPGKSARERATKEKKASNGKRG